MGDNGLGTLIGGIIAIDVVHHVMEHNRHKRKRRKHHPLLFDDDWRI